MSLNVTMALSSASTDTQVDAAYDDNAGYDVPPSTSMCEQFVLACRMLLRRRANTLSVSGRSITRDSIQHQLDQATAWYQQQARGRSRFVRTQFADPGRVS